jgi:hypothetical protein
MSQVMVVKAAKPVIKDAQGLTVVDLGFSGSRHGMNDFQKAFLKKLLQNKTGIFRHGDCVGSDSEAHDIVRSLGADRWKIHIHPPREPSLRAFKTGDVIHPEKAYYDRNKDIAENCNVFIATPKLKKEIGGTWYTINYFRKILTVEFGQNVPPRMGFIVLRDGTVGNITVMSRNRAMLQ